MLNAVWGFIVAMLRLGWRTITLRSSASDIPHATQRVAKGMSLFAYLVTYGLTYLHSGGHFAAAVMTLSAWATLAAVRRRYGPSKCAAAACMVTVFVIGFVGIMAALPAGTALKIYAFCGWVALYYIAAIRLLRQTPENPGKAINQESR
ncbi:hypothetical protein [Geopseudomonas aromaticivorans]